MPIGQVGKEGASSGGGGGITNSAGANVVPKSNGTNLVASRITDNGSTGIAIPAVGLIIGGNLALDGTVPSDISIAAQTDGAGISIDSANSAAGAGGYLHLDAGHGGGTYLGAFLDLSGGNTGVAGGNAQLSCGSGPVLGGTLQVTAGNASAVAGVGGNAIFTAGYNFAGVGGKTEVQGGYSGAGTGGDIWLTAGDGSVTQGAVRFKNGDQSADILSATTSQIKLTPADVTLSDASYHSLVALATDGSGKIIVAASDERLKDIVAPFSQGLDVLAEITPQSFLWKDGRIKGEQAGLIAQDVQRAAPLAVNAVSDEMGTLQINQGAMNALLVNAVKQLLARVEKLEAALT